MPLNEITKHDINSHAFSVLSFFRTNHPHLADSKNRSTRFTTLTASQTQQQQQQNYSHTGPKGRKKANHTSKQGRKDDGFTPRRAREWREIGNRWVETAPQKWCHFTGLRIIDLLQQCEHSGQLNLQRSAAVMKSSCCS